MTENLCPLPNAFGCREFERAIQNTPPKIHLYESLFITRAGRRLEINNLTKQDLKYSP